MIQFYYFTKFDKSSLLIILFSYDAFSALSAYCFSHRIFTPPYFSGRIIVPDILAVFDTYISAVFSRRGWSSFGVDNFG